MTDNREATEIPIQAERIRIPIPELNGIQITGSESDWALEIKGHPEIFVVLHSLLERVQPSQEQELDHNLIRSCEQAVERIEGLQSRSPVVILTFPLHQVRSMPEKAIFFSDQAALNRAVVILAGSVGAVFDESTYKGIPQRLRIYQPEMVGELQAAAARLESISVG
ncbi:hypothetical protein ISS86_02390 [Candidatus Microgenomates bacterium]|nr:hypothetical protein [Candidatus Microgenomates bacterium]